MLAPLATKPRVLSSQAAYHPDEVEAYVAWAEDAIGRMRHELRALTSPVDVVAEARREADRLVEEARRQSAELLRVALNDLQAVARHQSPPKPVAPRSRVHPGTYYDVAEVDRYVAWVTTTIGQLRRELDEARVRRRSDVISAQAEADELLAEARRQAAAVVADARCRLRDSVAAERLRRSDRVPEPPPPAPPPASPVDHPGPSAVTVAAPASREPRAEENPEPIWARRGRLMRNTGVLIVMFVLYQLFGTNLEADHSQQRLMTAFARSLGPRPASAAVPGPGQPSGSVSPSSTSPEAGTPPLPGDAVAIIQIPRFGLEQAVVEGTSVSDLRKGPGHYAGTPLPGQAGNSGIAGHRTTYGAPFNHVDELAPGDPIIVRTRTGIFRYEVTGHDVVKPTQVDVLLPKGDNRLTLTTCHPKYSARQRYVVWATLSPETPPVNTTGPSVPTPDRSAGTGAAVGKGPGGTDSPTIVSDGSSSFHLAALPGTLFWALVLGGGWRMAKRWARAWRRAPVLVSPALAYGLLHAFRSLSHFLPSNF